VPEHTDESAYDPFIQLLRAFALVGHENNVLIDLVANECTLPTAKLTETVRNMLRLIGYEMSPASPSSAEMVFELAKVFTAPYEALIPERAQMSNRREGSNPVVYFEVLEALDIIRTDQFSKAFSKEDGAFTDRTVDMNTPGGTFQPWATPAAGDELYWGHQDVMWNKLGVWLTVAAANIIGVWEYYDGEWRKTNPETVELATGGKLRMNLNNYLGNTNRQGTRIRAQYNETTAYEDLVSLWDGTDNYILTTGYLGQTSPSLVETDYTIGSDWEELECTDGTNQLQQTGGVEFALPQSVTRNWIKGAVNGVEAYWLRYRITEALSPTAPTMEYGRMDQGKQYVFATAVQGRTFREVLGSSDGSPNQEFITAKDYFIAESETLTVDGDEWLRVSNFLESKPTDRHYRVVLGQSDRASIVFGDGTAGKIPPAALNNIAIVYRYGGDNDGNLGANTIMLDKTGLTYINRLWNPRAAAGWAEAEGATEESLERAKIAGPASLRTRETAIGPADLEIMTAEFTDDNGSKPFARSRVFEEGYGPKTMELCVVAKGGNAATADQLQALELYFNGDQNAHPPEPKRVVANQEVIPTNYTKKVIDIQATIYVTQTVETESVENQLAAVIQPEALQEDGVTWEWDFGGEVPLSRIIHEIFSVSDAITKVELTAPSADVGLAARELPALGTVSLNIIEI